MTDGEDVRTRVDDALRAAAARAYEAAHGVLGEDPADAPPPRWRWAVSPRVVVTACLTAAIVGALVIWAPRGTPSAIEATPIASIGSSEDATPSPGAAVLAVGGTVDVHVAGAVHAPAVYELVAGARVMDAIDAAGGATDQADLDAINLARRLVDGEQVRVPLVGQAATGGSAPADGRININTADAAALDTLPGVGPVLAARIVTYRDEHGPFTSVDGLDAVSGVGPSVLSGLGDLATV